ncbi:MAG: nicotinate-nucleotide--dimethylbenzimidazole phosphoribosyltransferase [Paracoccus sp. (in: a-proteobacteria)]|jgi:nicotinate-nucleotide--dimethylbenzimidazole phosphoribosyltransferase|uniref:nicotinate-nucleotide--dimethylbenzimidazole phosphoribosyltransferase n=1 Tax=unclassified Paracoccus (in: a-proteobacteria) TaxID=2688777 RepID=UPI000C557184|nr:MULTISPECIES: nicotinate-nucleotide--dimethylbenzimidazole phosphoribosyltransferase [unclassified Paracoccus (in: a-proteobacteria)]MAN57523.1 nicotinate-nucleotide--dimethylbenzimidazole phosphoribosyltransferase [Paracoccus sp. (in: a-proteobacteria)]MBA50058.1 nicotinate-nucleotide--dimethylbenzimidazole phosphoribosyltransferase [Paracoccus sp. (in: a-proteobacteria)]|tara:strand:+ start:631 stop:1584 length:954 start_codon:yes stop_codon:yes gene_type:complete
MTSFDETAAKAARDRQNSLTKPPGSLGRLEDLAVFMAGWQGRARPRLERAQALVFAGNHGVVAQNVNPFPAEVTALMVANFSAGGAAINQLCRVAGADLSVVALELDRPTADFTQNVAMTPDEVRAAMQAGADAVDSQADVLLLGEMGIGNSTVAAVLAAWTFGGRAEDWVGPGTGAEGEILANKLRAVTAGLARHDPMTAADALAAFGGREQAALCGAILRARELGLPVILDGFICTAAAAVLTRDDPDALSHCLSGHESAEPGHRRLIAALGLRPILSLDMRLGEGSGAAVALMVLRGALACHDGMATFSEAGIG